MLKGKVAVVTGGTRGIGYAVVELFLKNGASVALLGSRQQTVDKALASLKETNPDWPVIGMAPDLTDYKAVEETMNAVKEKGLLRSEGKDYVMADGDIVLFRFNV